MPIKITATVRATIVKIIDESAQYDASSVHITQEGDVTALKDADKTCAGNDPMRYLVGYVDDMVTPEGKVREGW